MAAELPTKINPVYIIGIDLGTARSGYSYSHIREERVSAHQGNENPKELTAILLNQDLSVVEFGKKAREVYESKSDKEKQFLFYFEKFKMNLYGDDLNKVPVIRAANGAGMSSIGVFASLLSYFKQESIKRINLGMVGNVRITDRDVKFIVTIPAIWSNGAKQIVREAALKAGLYKESDPSQFMFALESEAASLTCRRQLLQDQDLKDHATYMVMDLGGGTADYTVHKLNADKRITEVVASSGGPWGSVYIENNFQDLLSKIIGFNEASVPQKEAGAASAAKDAKEASPKATSGKELLTQYQQQHSSDFIQFMADFETAKDTFTKTDTSKRIRVPQTLIAFLETRKQDLAILCETYRNRMKAPGGIKIEDVEEGKDKQPYVAYTSNNGYLKLSSAAMRDLFAPVVQKIVEHMKHLLVKAPAISHIFLVGGFSESPIVMHEVSCALQDCQVIAPAQQDIKFVDHQKPKIRLVSPVQASLAVLTGATLFGLRPDIIGSRIMKHTYGIKSSERWEEARHKGRTRNEYIYDGEMTPYCTDCFSVFCNVGSSVKFDGETAMNFVRTYDQQKVMDITIYSCPVENPRFITDQGMRYLGVFTVPVSSDKGVDVRMRFGFTEILVTAKDNQTGESASLSVSFLK